MLHSFNSSQIGQRNSYSLMDIEKINKLYRCNDKGKIKTNHDDHEVSTGSFPLEPKLLPQCDTFQFCSDLDPVKICKISYQINVNIIFFKLCPNLASQGWCEMMPGKMLFECRKSCCNCYSKCTVI